MLQNVNKFLLLLILIRPIDWPFDFNKGCGYINNDFVCVVVDHFSYLNSPPVPVKGIIPFCNTYPNDVMCMSPDAKYNPFVPPLFVIPQ